MKISDVISSRGAREVITIAPDSSLADVLALLSEHRIGAVVVSSDGTAVEGIISERDAAQALHSDGGAALEKPASNYMTTDVATCEPQAALEDIAALMTQRRFRHVPVVQNGALIDLISIGDAVKAYISQVESERDHLMKYIHQ